MTRTPGPTTSWIAAIALLVAATAAAQDAGSIFAEDQPLISVRFDGGTAVEYVEAVRRAAGDINVIIAPEAAEVAMPPIRLQEVSPGAALELVGDQTHTAHGRRVQLRVQEVGRHDPRERPTYRIFALVTGRVEEQGAHVWTVAFLLDNDISSDAVLSAVEMALDVVGGGSELDVRFHKDTGLLIATGTEVQLDTIDEVVGRLVDSVGPRRADEMRLLEQKVQAERVAGQEAVARLNEMKAELERSRRMALDLRQEMASFEMQTNELRRMLDVKVRELSQAQAEVRALQLELEQHRQQRERSGG